jgi:NitT/TauT family transport system permease protein
LEKINFRLQPWYLIILVLLAWQILPSIGVVNATFLPPFTQVLADIPNVGLGRLATDILVSLRRILVSFLIATLLAVPAGFVLAGVLKGLARFIGPLMTFLSQIPPFILFPALLVLLGAGEVSVIAVIIWAGFWITLFATISGAGLVDPQLVKAARTMGADKLTVFTDVVLPTALPYIMTGIRSALTFAFLILIGAETMGASAGLGWEIHMSQMNTTIPRTYLMVLVVAVVGLGINYLAELAERKLVVWKEDESGELREALA